MKDKLMKNLGLKILSLLIAVIIWLVIINVDDPIITEKFEDIPVTVVNGDVITEKDKVYTITSGSKVDISVTGRREFVQSLTNSDVVATADLSKLSITGAAYIEAKVTKYTTTNPKVELGSTKMLTVELENKIEKTFPVEIRLSGEIDSGYTIIEKSASPNMITVSGAESVISKIHNVILDINVQGRTTSFQKNVRKDEFQVYDNNGDRIDNSKLGFSVDEATVSATLQKTKEVKLDITTVGEPRNGYKVHFEYEPKTIIVTGDEETLNSLSVIPFEYDITDRYEDYEENLAISDDLLDVIKNYGVSLVDETQTIAITFQFEKLVTEEVKLEKDDIEIRNLRSGYQVDINTKMVQSLVQGSADIVGNLSAADLKPYIDLLGYQDETVLVNVKFAGVGEFEIMNKPTINVTIRKIEPEVVGPEND